MKDSLHPPVAIYSDKWTYFDKLVLKRRILVLSLDKYFDTAEFLLLPYQAFKFPTQNFRPR